MASRLENAVRRVIAANTSTKIAMDDIIAKYPEGVCISHLEYYEYGGVTIAKMTCVEEPGKYFTSSGKLVKAKFTELLNDYDDDLEAFNADLETMYLKMKFVRIKKQDNSGNYVLPTLLGVVPVKTYVDENGNEVDKETGEVTFPNREESGGKNFGDDVPF